MEPVIHTSSFAGRRRELEHIKHTILITLSTKENDEPKKRILQITGPPGIGKTTLSYEILRWTQTLQAAKSLYVNSFLHANMLSQLVSEITHDNDETHVIAIIDCEAPGSSNYHHRLDQSLMRALETYKNLFICFVSTVAPSWDNDALRDMVLEKDVELSALNEFAIQNAFMHGEEAEKIVKFSGGNPGLAEFLSFRTYDVTKHSEYNDLVKTWCKVRFGLDVLKQPSVQASILPFAFLRFVSVDLMRASSNITDDYAEIELNQAMEMLRKYAEVGLLKWSSLHQGYIWRGSINTILQSYAFADNAILITRMLFELKRLLMEHIAKPQVQHVVNLAYLSYFISFGDDKNITEFLNRATQQIESLDSTEGVRLDDLTTSVTEDPHWNDIIPVETTTALKRELKSLKKLTFPS